MCKDCHCEYNWFIICEIWCFKKAYWDIWCKVLQKSWYKYSFLSREVVLSLFAWNLSRFWSVNFSQPLIAASMKFLFETKRCFLSSHFLFMKYSWLVLGLPKSMSLHIWLLPFSVETSESDLFTIQNVIMFYVNISNSLSLDWCSLFRDL